MIVTIRRAEEHDIDGIKKLLFEARRLRQPDWKGRYFIGGLSYDDSELAEAFRNDVYPYYVAADDQSGETVGFMLCMVGTITDLKPYKVTPIVHILDLCLSPAAVKEKVDLMLLDQARELAEKENCRKVIVGFPFPNL